MKKQRWWLVLMVAILSLLIGAMLQAATAVPETASLGAMRLHVESSGQEFTVTGPAGSAPIGARVVFKVPPGQTRLALVRFSAPSSCESDPQGGRCIVFLNILTGPTSEITTNVEFDSDGTGSEGFESHSTEHGFGPLGPGTYTATVEIFASGGGTTFILHGWDLSVEEWRVT
jgi:hypothetical protein